MATVPDPVVMVNLVLSVVILVLGCLVFRKRNNFDALLVGIGFGMFGLSHLNALLGLGLFPEVTFVILRICGYLLVAAALYLILTAPEKQ